MQTPLDTYKPATYFRKDVIDLITPQNGYVSTQDVSPNHFTQDDCVELKNFIILPDGISLRPPYLGINDVSISDLMAILPSGYTIHKVIEKYYTDKTTGTEQKIYLVACYKDATSKLKLYASHYYLPETSYDNSWNAANVTRGWVRGWVNLFERYYVGNPSSESPNSEEIISDLYYMGTGTGNQYLISHDAVFMNKPKDYFKGWYVIDDNGEIAGIVLETNYGSPGTNIISIRVDVDVSKQLALSHCGICRFQVAQGAKDTLVGLNDVHFNIDQYNVVRMTGKDKNGHNIRPIGLYMLNERHYANGYAISTPTYNGTPTGWLTPQGFYTGESETTITVEIRGRKYFLGVFRLLEFEYRIDGGAWLFFRRPPESAPFHTHAYFTVQLLGLSLTVNAPIDSFFTNAWTVATFQIRKVSARTSWNGFWLDYTAPKVNKKNYYYWNETASTGSPLQPVHSATGAKQELGVYYEAYSYLNNNADKPFRAYSSAIELDNYQTFFTSNHVTGGSGSKHMLNFKVKFHKWFNRRISGHYLFYDDFDNFTKDAGQITEIPPTYLLDESHSGQVKMENIPVTTDMATNEFIWDMNLFVSETSTEKLVSYADAGLPLESYLNGFYRSDVNVRPYQLIRVGPNMMGINCELDSDTDKDSRQITNAYTMVCVSQKQNGAIYCEDILSTQRLKQQSIGFPLRGGVGIMGNQFIVFSQAMGHLREILAEDNLVIRNVADFENKGLITPDGSGIVKAVDVLSIETGQETAPLVSEYKGIFWLSYNDIYTISGNRAVSIVEDRNEYDTVLRRKWKQEYQNIPSSVRAQVIQGYHANNEQVWYFINNTLYIYQLSYNRWIIYELADTPLGFVSAADGELLIYTSNAVYKTEPIGTTAFKDKGTVEIDSAIALILNHGNPLVPKIPDGFNVNYDITAVENPITTFTIEANVAVTDEEGTEIYNKNIELATSIEPQKKFERRGYDKRIRSSRYKFRLSSVDNSNMKKFKITQLRLTAQVAEAVTLTEQT